MTGQLIAYIGGSIAMAGAWLIAGILSRKAWDKSTGRGHGRGHR